MDKETINFYNKNANAIAEKYKQFRNDRLIHLANTFFHKNFLTLDLGCGSGRDLNILKNEFVVEGCDASGELIKIAKANNPQIEIFQDHLPNLSKINDNKYYNIFCSAVFMHVPKDQHIQSVINLLRITRIDGVIILSFRNKTIEDVDARLYENINSNKLISLFESLGGKLVFQESQQEISQGNFKKAVAKLLLIDSQNKVQTFTQQSTCFTQFCSVGKIAQNLNKLFVKLKKILAACI